MKVSSFKSFHGHVIDVAKVSYVSPVRELEDLGGNPLAGFTFVVGPAEVYVNLTGRRGVEEIKVFHAGLVMWLMREEVKDEI